MNPTDYPDRASLTHALEAIATGAERTHALRAAPDAGLAIADVRAAARRRRTRFEAGAGLVAAAVVGGLVLGGAALARTDRPGPPANVPLPTTSAPDNLACPGALGEATVVDGPLVVELTLDSSSVVAGTTVTGRVVVADGGGGEVPLDPSDVPAELAGELEFALLLDNQVVASAPNTAADPQGLSGRLGSTTLVALDLEPCGGGAVPAGDYVLAAMLRVTTGDASGLEGVVIGVAPLTVAPATDAGAAPRLPTCGASTGSLVSTSGAVTGSTQVRVGDVDDASQFVHQGYGDTLAIDATLVNNGPDLSGALGIQMEAVVARDGVVVATLPGEETDPPPVDWPAGGVRATGLVDKLQVCDGAALTPGDYTLWLWAVTSSVDGVDGGTVPLWRFAIVAQPVRFHVYAQDDPDFYGPVTYTSEGEAGWTDVDLSAVPAEVPLALEGSDVATGVRAYEDGRRWDVSVYFETSGDRAYDNARAALLAAGFAVLDEDAAPLPDGWAWGDFSRDDLTVHVDTNTTGDGWSGEILIVRSS